jgi:hypothetical protein
MGPYFRIGHVSYKWGRSFSEYLLNRVVQYYVSKSSTRFKYGQADLKYGETVFEIKLVRRIFDNIRNKGRGERRKLLNEVHRSLYSTSSVVTTVKSRGVL